MNSSNRYLILMLIALSASCPGQNSFRLFYGINEVSSPTLIAQLDSLVKKLEADSCVLSVYGYADYLGAAAANRALAQQRADVVCHRLQQSGNKRLVLTECQGKGQQESAKRNGKRGDPMQRRVDVVYKLLSPLPISAAKPVTKARPSPPVYKDLTQLKKGENLVLGGLSFVPGRHIWIPSSDTILASLLETLRERPTMKIEIQGHICCLDGSGDALDYDTYDIRLSENRARAIYDYLVAKGIAGGRLRYKGYGHSRPKIIEEKSVEDEQANRRVEIKVLEE